MVSFFRLPLDRSCAPMPAPLGFESEHIIAARLEAMQPFSG